jgi:hypothetical protein
MVSLRALARLRPASARTCVMMAEGLLGLGSPQLALELALDRARWPVSSKGSRCSACGGAAAGGGALHGRQCIYASVPAHPGGCLLGPPRHHEMAKGAQRGAWNPALFYPQGVHCHD